MQSLCAGKTHWMRKEQEVLNWHPLRNECTGVPLHPTAKASFRTPHLSRVCSEVPGAWVPVMVQLLFDVHHVSSGFVKLPVVTFSELLEVTKFWNPRPGCVWKEKRSGEVDRNASTQQPSKKSQHIFSMAGHPSTQS